MAEPFWKEPQSLWVELKELFGGLHFKKRTTGISYLWKYLISLFKQILNGINFHCKAI